jgi:hypothetical protein
VKKTKRKELLLMALIKMKATNHHSKLGVAKKLHEDMFTKEKLLERLYQPHTNDSEPLGYGTFSS